MKPLGAASSLSMRQKLLNRIRPYLPIIGGAVLGVLIMLLYLQLNPPGGRFSDADIGRIADEHIQAVTPSPPVEPEIFALLRPSVVLITRGPPGGGEGQSVGSGVVVDTNGSILTAYHVVANTDSVNVTFFDGTMTRGFVTQKQPERDLAIVQVRNLPGGVPAATLSGGVRQGDEVLAIGAPFGFEGSVSSGIVSGVNRSFNVRETGQTLQGLIQFDAAVNPGNSGGPLVDRNGRVVGIVSAIFNPTDQRVFIGLGFAVPIEAASGIFAPLG